MLRKKEAGSRFLAGERGNEVVGDGVGDGVAASGGSKMNRSRKAPDTQSRLFKIA